MLERVFYKSMSPEDKQQKDKIFKDPIYGYISVPRKYIEIIDSPSFQRLRRISQTSYSPLYSSALHNRFVHSMGVFHLARMAVDSLKNDSESKSLFNKINSSFDCFEVFELAALLHDVGHSPFSHTGEKYYLCGDEFTDRTLIHNELKDLVDDDDFSLDIDELDFGCAPHEIMSAIVGLKQFHTFFVNAEARSLFARCITGYQYGGSEKRRDIGTKEMILNCLITLLNSKVIDVDKLDYLIRDAYIIGYDTINIDYVRLLKALTIIPYASDHQYEVAFHKSAVSVIENVIYARDAEKKWIQGHPVVLYESYLVQEIILEYIMSRGVKAFSSESLSSTGILLDADQDIYIRLLCDDDIITFAKNQMTISKAAEQYFDRSRRMHAFWKSEAEFNARLLKEMNDKGKTVARLFIEKTIRPKKDDKVIVVDDKLYERIKNSRDKDLRTAETRGIDYSLEQKEYNVQLKVIEFLFDYAERKQMEKRFVIIAADSFSSGFDKNEFKALKIIFDDSWRLDEVLPTLKTKKDEKDREDNVPLFYIFYSRNDDEREEYNDFCSDLAESLNSIGKEIRLK